MRTTLRKFESATIPQLYDFAQSLIKNGFTEKTASKYCTFIRTYEKTGLPFDKDTAEEHFTSIYDGSRNVLGGRRAVTCFIDFVNGVEPKRLLDSYIRRTKKRTPYSGCDEDCENCKYSDCVKPDALCY